MKVIVEVLTPLLFPELPHPVVVEVLKSFNGNNGSGVTEVGQHGRIFQEQLHSLMTPL